MVKKTKIETVKNLTEKLRKAQSVVFVDYQGLTNPQLEEVRAQVKKVGGQLMVVKNTLLKLALEQAQKPKGEAQNLIGPTAVLLALEDNLSPLKAWAAAGQGGYKFGFDHDRVLRAEEIVRLAELPGIFELRAEAVRALAGPMAKLLNTMKANLRSLIDVLKNLKVQS